MIENNVTILETRGGWDSETSPNYYLPRRPEFTSADLYTASPERKYPCPGIDHDRELRMNLSNEFGWIYSYVQHAPMNAQLASAPASLVTPAVLWLADNGWKFQAWKESIVAHDEYGTVVDVATLRLWRRTNSATGEPAIITNADMEEAWDDESL